MSVSDDAPAEPGPRRRDFLTLVTTATAAVGAGAFVWPFLHSLDRPAADAADTAVDVDLAPLAPGQQIVVVWRGMPVFVLRRTRAAQLRLQESNFAASLRDPTSQQPQQPEYATNWHRSQVPEFGVMVGICTHLGCIPRLRPAPEPSGPTEGWPGGYVCPCHGSRFDLAGRVFVGAPAQYNLPVPPYRMIEPTRLQIGQGPPGSTFDFADIAKL